MNHIKTTAEVCGSKITPEAAVMMVSDLQRYSYAEILAGLKRCREELKPEKGFVHFNLAVLLEKMNVIVGKDLVEAEAEEQWALLNQKLSWYDDSDGCYWVGGHPALNERARQAVDRMGGFKKLELHAKLEDWHFTKRDFLESYHSHEAVQYARKLNGRSGLTAVGDIVKNIQLPENVEDF